MKLFGNRRSGEHTEHTQPGADTEIEVSEIRSDEAGGGTEAVSAGDAQSAARKRVLRRVLIIAGAIVAAAAIAVGAYFIWEKPLERPDPPAPPKESVSPSPSVSNPPLAGPAETKDPGAEDGEPVDDEGALSMTAGYRDGVFTFLLVGTDKASNSTDTIMVVSFDTKGHKINCVNIPRDTLINIGWATSPKKINVVYPGYFNTYSGNPGGHADFDSPEAYGVYGLREYVHNMLGFYVDYYVLVDIQAVEDIVDTIGGVEFDVPEDMVYRDPTQDLDINIRAGRQVLNGEDAVKLCRFRNTYAAGDLKRIEVQQSFLKAMARQLISLKSIPHLTELLEIVEREVNTDLEVANVAWLVRQFLACSTDDITFQTAPISAGSTSINDVSFVGVDAEAWLELVNGCLNPLTEDIRPGDIDLLTFNAGGVYATSGVIAGGYDSFYCLRCTVATGRTVSHAPGAHLVLETEEPEAEAPEGWTETGGEPTAGGPAGEALPPAEE